MPLVSFSAVFCYLIFFFFCCLSDVSTAIILRGVIGKMCNKRRIKQKGISFFTYLHIDVLYIMLLFCFNLVNNKWHIIESF